MKLPRRMLLRKLRKREALSVKEAHERVERVAVRTEEDMAGPTQAQIDHWLKHSYGSWRRNG